MVRYTHAIIARTGATHTHPGQNQRAQRAGHSVAREPITSAPSAAVAVQPYHHISGARKSIAGSAHAQEDDAKRRIDGKQCKPSRPRYHIDEREPRAVGQREATKYGSERHDPKPMMSFTT